jgi:hypothetical protein
MTWPTGHQYNLLIGGQRRNSAETPNAKHQTPKKSQRPTAKSGRLLPFADSLGFGV